MKPKRKAFRFEVKELKEDSAAQTVTIVGYGSVFGNIDLGGDVVDKGAFARTINANKSFPLLWQHNPDSPIGKTVDLVEDENGLQMTAVISTATQLGKECVALLKLGAISGLSIGYSIIQKFMDGTIRHLSELKLWEISVVTFPMNQLAGVASVKSLKDADDIKAAVQLFQIKQDAEQLSESLSSVLGNKEKKELGECLEILDGTMGNLMALRDYIAQLEGNTSDEPAESMGADPDLIHSALVMATEATKSLYGRP